MQSTPLVIAGTEIRPGSRVRIDFPLADLYTSTPMSMPIQVIRGRRSGPVMFISGAIHGDEINGVEIIHRLLRSNVLKSLRGTLICIPIVNVFGFINQTRYLPDGRDLNRSFPGSEHGSLTSRVAYLFLNEIAAQCHFGIDLHTAAAHRDNLPQIRADLDDPATLELARGFHVPVMIHSNTRDGSLRQAAGELGVKVLLFEGGERLRFNERVIRAGVHGIIATLRTLDMLPARVARLEFPPALIARGTRWIRAQRSGIHRISAELGQSVHKGSRLGAISDPFGAFEDVVQADLSGVIIGRNNLPLISEGDALFHVARVDSARLASSRVEAFEDAIDNAESFQPTVDPPTY